MSFKKVVISFITSVFVLSLFVSPLGQVASAKNLENELDEELVTDVAEKLEFIWEEASIKDKTGKIIGFDLEKIESEYGASNSEDQQFIDLINAFNAENNNSKLGNYKVNLGSNGGISLLSGDLDGCLNKKISDYFGSFLAPAALAAIYQLLWDGEYTEAAKRLIKLGVKGNVFAIAGSLSVMFATCLVSEEGWI